MEEGITYFKSKQPSVVSEKENRGLIFSEKQGQKLNLLGFLFLTTHLLALSVSKAIRDAVIARAGGKCEITGRKIGKGGHVHHREGSAKGGNDEMDNLVYIDPSVHDYIHQIEDGFSPRQTFRHQSSWQGVEQADHGVMHAVMNFLFGESDTSCGEW